MPFYMLQAGKDHFNMNGLSSLSRRSANMIVPQPARDRRSSSLSTDSSSGLTTLEAVSEVGYEDEISLVSHESINHDTNSPSTIPAQGFATLAVHHPLHFDEGPTMATRTSVVIHDRVECQKTYPQLPPRVQTTALPRRPVFQHSMKPHALCLTVSLSRSSFLRMHTSSSKRPTTLDVKMDVFFNGELCASTYVPERYRSEANNLSELTQRFSGRRIARLQERPWLIVPPGQSADGSLREHKRSKGAYAGANQRWMAISEALRAEAAKGGKNKHDELSVLGQYLESLSKLEMPTEVESLQKAGGPKFGVIDVVLTTGKGQKDFSNSPYIAEPTRMRLSEYKADNRRGMEVDQTPKHRSKTSADHRVVTVPSLEASAAIEVSSDTQNYPRVDPFVTPMAPSAAPSAVRRRRDRILEGSSLRAPILPRNQAHNSYLDLVGRLGDASISEPRQRRNTSSTSDSSMLSSSPTQVSHGLDSLQTPPATSSPSGCLGTTRSSDDQQNDNINRSHSETPWAKASPPSDSLPCYSENTTTIIQQSSSNSNILRPRKPRNAPQSSTAEPSTQTRRRRNAHCTPQVQTSPSDIPTGRQRLSLNARARQRSVKGYFIKGTDTAEGSPRRPATATQSRSQSIPAQSKPQVVPQKRYKGVDFAPEDEPKPKRSRLAYHVVLDTKMTLLEEIESIEAAAKEDHAAETRESRARLTRTSFASTEATPAPVSVPSQHQPQQAIQEKVSSSTRLGKNKVTEPFESMIGKLARQVTPADATFSRTPCTLKLAPELIEDENSILTSSEPQKIPLMPTSSPVTNLTAPFSPQPEAAPSELLARPRSSRRRPKPKPATNTTDTSATQPIPWQPPASSNDCVITYADWSIRQVKAERSGWFQEVGILMGVRFLIG